MTLINEISSTGYRAHKPSRTLLEHAISMMSLYRQRRALKGLDANALADLGITAQEAASEAARPIWDAPGHFKR